jgi:hypothetical protein
MAYYGSYAPSPQGTFHDTKNYIRGSVYNILNENPRITSYLLQSCYLLQRHTYTVVLLEPGTCRSSNLNWNIWVGKLQMQGCNKQHNLHPTWHSNTIDPSYFILYGMWHGLLTTSLLKSIRPTHYHSLCHMLPFHVYRISVISLTLNSFPWLISTILHKQLACSETLKSNFLFYLLLITILAMQQLRWLVAGFPLWWPGFKPESGMWDLWWTKWRWGSFLWVLQFPLPIIILPIAPQSPSSIFWGWYNRPVVTAVPSGLRLKTLRRIKYKKKPFLCTEAG